MPLPDRAAATARRHGHRHADDPFERRKPDRVPWGWWILLGEVLVVAPTWAALMAAFIVGDPLRH
ncbi:hypothetical protein ACFVU0_04825 [Streptomyces sp. NPDC058122]|uniref:hypothetical protein n=1 Tax=Streptomyces sp. NPDC058122 TaxID=3346349 RepID=UPI0036E6C86E